jgi:SAM-dependent methyltransferase
MKTIIKIDRFPSPLNVDLACGDRKGEGFVGVDIVDIPSVDIVCDLDEYHWPFEDNSVDKVMCSHFIEHTRDLIKFMNELHRILKPGGKALLAAPYYASVRAWQDPTHVRAISYNTFLYYNKDWMKENKLEHYGITADFKIEHKLIIGDKFAPVWKDLTEEARQYAMDHLMNVIDDIHVTLTKI